MEKVNIATVKLKFLGECPHCKSKYKHPLHWHGKFRVNHDDHVCDWCKKLCCSWCRDCPEDEFWRDEMRHKYGDVHTDHNEFRYDIEDR